MPMVDQQKPPSLEEIGKVRDHAERARQAVTFTTYAETSAREGRAVRDQALRDLKDAKVSIPKIAEQTGVNIATVKAVLR